MTWPRDYKATDDEVRRLAERVQQDYRERQEATRAKVREFQATGKESVE